MALSDPARIGSGELQLVTFYVGDLLLGLDIHCVQEINRQLASRWIPQAPAFVRGVINLRGDVATLVDLRTVLDMTPGRVTSTSRNLIIKSNGELIGLMVDRLGDILTIDRHEIESPPANVNGVDGKFFRGVHTLESEIVVILDLDAALSG